MSRAGIIVYVYKETYLGTSAADWIIMINMTICSYENHWRSAPKIITIGTSSRGCMCTGVILNMTDSL